MAALRRGDAAAVLSQPAFHRLTAGFDDPEFAGDGAERWATVVQGIALTGAGAAGDAEPAGRTLATLGFSESRLSRLLSARGEAFRTQVTLLARFARGKGASLDWRDLGELVLVEERVEPRAEELRLRLARSYYRALDKGAQPAA
jgi:CRISPR system Cascade subunit CasB